MIIREENEALSKEQYTYIIVLRDNDIANEVMRLWNEPFEYDDLAFMNVVYGEIKIKIKEVKKIM